MAEARCLNILCFIRFFNGLFVSEQKISEYHKELSVFFLDENQEIVSSSYHYNVMCSDHRINSQIPDRMVNQSCYSADPEAATPYFSDPDLDSLQYSQYFIKWSSVVSFSDSFSLCSVSVSEFFCSQTLFKSLVLVSNGCNCSDCMLHSIGELPGISASGLYLVHVLFSGFQDGRFFNGMFSWNVLYK